MFSRISCSLPSQPHTSNLSDRSAWPPCACELCERCRSRDAPWLSRVAVRVRRLRLCESARERCRSGCREAKRARVSRCVHSQGSRVDGQLRRGGAGTDRIDGGDGRPEVKKTRTIRSISSLPTRFLGLAGGGRRVGSQGNDDLDRGRSTLTAWR